MATLVSTAGLSQTAARLLLRTKAAYLEVELPPGSELWSVELDGKPAKPQREGQRLLLSLPAKDAAALRDLRIVYETPTGAVGFWDRVQVPALSLMLRTEGPSAVAREIPVADVIWHVSLPRRVPDHASRGDGCQRSDSRCRSRLPWSVAKAVYRLTGGIHPFYGMAVPSLSRAREVTKRTAAKVKEYEAEAGLSSDEGRKLEALGYAGEAGRAGAHTCSVIQCQSRARGEGSVAAARGGKAAGLWALEGVRSLKIKLERSGDAVPFQSLGFDPRLDLTLANVSRLRGLAWGIALVVGLLGLVLTNRSRRAKVKYVVGVMLLATLVPVVSGRAELAYLANPAFFIATLLVPYYLAVLLGRRTLAAARRMTPGAARATRRRYYSCCLRRRGALAAELLIDAGAEDPLLVPLGGAVRSRGRFRKDAIIVPYGPECAHRRAPIDGVGLATDVVSAVYGALEAGPARAARRTHRRRLTRSRGADYSVTLGDGEEFSVEGRLEIDVFVDGQVAVPIRRGRGRVGARRA